MVGCPAALGGRSLIHLHCLILSPEKMARKIVGSNLAVARRNFEWGRRARWQGKRPRETTFVVVTCCLARNLWKVVSQPLAHPPRKRSLLPRKGPCPVLSNCTPKERSRHTGCACFFPSSSGPTTQSSWAGPRSSRSGRIPAHHTEQGGSLLPWSKSSSLFHGESMPAQHRAAVITSCRSRTNHFRPECRGCRRQP